MENYAAFLPHHHHHHRSSPPSSSSSSHRLSFLPSTVSGGDGGGRGGNDCGPSFHADAAAAAADGGAGEACRMEPSADLVGEQQQEEGEEEEEAMAKKKEKKARKHRYAFQTRSQVDILDDGYRWRKYGQKAVKNNSFPRSYYRCTHQGCNVKKQVQRLAKDEGIVVTTYEGVHTHPIERPSDNFEHILKQMQVNYSHF